MTKRKSKSTKTTVKAAAAKGSVRRSSTASPLLIVLGFDEQQKPRGARFINTNPGLVTKAADAMGFKVYQATPPDVAEVAKFVPNIPQDLYSDLVVALALEPQAALSKNGNGDKDSLPAARGLPQSWGEIGAGHLVIARESLDYGWWEAIVLDRQGDSFILQYRDYPHLPKFVRHRSGIAMMSPPTDEAKPVAQVPQA